MAIQESVESMNQLQLPETHNRETRRLVFEHVFSGDERVAIITAAPGSGKSTALLNLALTLLEQPKVQRIAIAAQTNNQATDLALKLVDLIKAKGLDSKLAYRSFARWTLMVCGLLSRARWSRPQTRSLFQRQQNGGRP